MTRLTLCIAQQHDLPLVALTLLVCLCGSAAAAQLFGRIRSATGRTRLGWILLAGVATGTMVWSTHFVAMMAFRTVAPVVLDPNLTLLSLLVAIALAAVGMSVAAIGRTWSGVTGGGIISVAISTMHYLGMAAYRIDGIVTWDWHYVAASVLLSMLLSAAAFHILAGGHGRRNLIGAGLLGLAVVALHFTGMTAMNITVMTVGGGLSDTTLDTLGITTAVAALIVVGCAAVSALIDDQTQSESYQRLHIMALHDGLTTLPNRMSFAAELSRRLVRKSSYPSMAVVVFDLSRFKVVNDTHGHQAGDHLLFAIARRMSAMLSSGEYMARLGGDEFAGLISYRKPDELWDFLRRITTAFESPFEVNRLSLSIAANIGVALASGEHCNADSLLAEADLAMYRAKFQHSTQPCFYDAKMDDAVRTQRELATDLGAAVKSGAFELNFQVQALVDTGEIIGYEALARWHHPTRGTIPPKVFIRLAEATGEIVPLSIWILRRACVEAAAWPNHDTVSVNLSPTHLSDSRLVETVRSALVDSGLPAERLILELTESAIIQDKGYALEQLRALKALGVAIALDDFGTGYSSLDVLRSFPFDRIKLDASFVAEIENNEQAVLILRSVTGLGSTLRTPVLAEGIERSGQLSIVAQEGCMAIQGYLIGRPSRSLADPHHVREAMMLTPYPLSSGMGVALG